MAIIQNPPVIRGPGRPRDEEARNRILHAALKLMEEIGFAQVTIEAIAGRAGASKATVYRWWPNKAAVVIEAFRESVAAELPLLDTGSLRDDLRAQVRNFARVLSGRGAKMMRAVIVAAQSDPDVAVAYRTFWSEPRRALARTMLKRKQQRGQLRKDADPDLLLDALYGPLYYRFLVKNEPPSQKYAEALVDLVLRGLVHPAKSTK